MLELCTLHICCVLNFHICYADWHTLGIIITVSVLVAAGIAVYESPQFRRWLNNSRRKIAVALHNLGDDIHPGDQSYPLTEDISMTEEVGEAAEERRRKAREEIMRRAALLETRWRKKSGPAGSFDELVDKDGNLLKPGEFEDLEDPMATSTAIDTTGGSQVLRRHDGPPPAYHPEPSDTNEKEKLHLDIPSETSSSHPSESLVDLTPTSETSNAVLGSSGFHEVPQSESLAQSEYFSIPSRRSSSHTGDGAPDFYYAHPNNLTSRENQGISNPFANPQGHEPAQISSAPSLVGSSASRIQNETADTSSDGTLSEIGHPVEGTITPTSWSEIGSVVSNDDVHYR